MGSSRFYFAISAIIAILSTQISADQLHDIKPTWRVGIAEFKPIHLSSENSYLSSSYPLLLMETLLSADVHVYSGEELNLYRELILEKEAERLRGDLDKARYKRDVSAVKGGAEDGDIEALESQLEEIHAYDALTIIVNGHKPVEIAQQGEQGLFPVVEFALDKAASEHDLDMLIFGSIEEIESYLFVDIKLYMPAGEKTEVLRIAFSRDLLEEASVEIQDELLSRVLGREWARLIVTAPYEDADIFVDGAFKGIRRVTVENLVPGAHQVEVRAFGYETYQKSLDLVPNQMTEHNITLTAADEALVTVNTLPDGAQVYALSEYQGLTPLNVPRTGRAVQAIIRKDGYADFLLPVLPDNQDDITITLLPEAMDREKLMEKQRTRFYTIFGAFVLSLPIPIYLFDVTNGLTLTFLSEAEIAPSDRNVAEARRILKLRNMSFSGSIGGFFLSAVLLLDAIFELATYLDLARLSTY